MWSAEKRKRIWDAVWNDDANMLSSEIQTTAHVDESTSQLWNPRKRNGIMNRNILEVVSMQKTGVNLNQGQATRCLAFLLDSFGDIMRDKMVEIHARCRRLALEKSCSTIERHFFITA